MRYHSHPIDIIIFYSFSSFSFLHSCRHHRAAQMPAKYRKNKVKPRGVSNRNRGLEWIRANASDGVLYFADDDNTYDLDIFDEVRIENTFNVFSFPFSTICLCLFNENYYFHISKRRNNEKTFMFS
jgi:hypothetical protein